MHTDPGTFTRPQLSAWQRARLIAVWLFIVALGGLMLSQSQGLGGWLALVIVGMTIFGVVVSIPLTRNPDGTPVTQIVEPEAMRGEFVIRRFAPVIGGLLTLQLVLVCALALWEGDAQSTGWAATALIALLIYATALVWTRAQVQAFRVNDDSTVEVLQRGQWRRLDPADYGRVIGQVNTGRGISYPSRVDFLNPLNRLPPARIPLAWVISRRYRSHTHSHVIDAFFRSLCRDAGYDIQPRGKGWIATRADGEKRKRDEKPKRDGKPKRGL